MVEYLQILFDWILSSMGDLWAMYTGGSVLGFAIVLWILDHFLDIFDILKR